MSDEKIVIPLDGSELGESALPYIGELVSKLSPEVKVEVILLHVVPMLTRYVVVGEVSAPVPYTEKEMEQIKANALAYLNKASEGLRNKNNNITITTRVAVGNDVDEIIKTADEVSADLIAMSTHGRSGFSRWAFGSVTDKVLRGGNRPVLVVRASKKGGKA